MVIKLNRIRKNIDRKTLFFQFFEYNQIAGTNKIGKYFIPAPITINSVPTSFFPFSKK